jgi:hypothetical protein
MIKKLKEKHLANFSSRLECASSTYPNIFLEGLQAVCAGDILLMRTKSTFSTRRKAK